MFTKALSRLFGKSGDPYSSVKLIIVGMGNPGPKYTNSRHNLGFMCIDWLSKEHSIPLSERRRYVAIGKGELGGQPVVLAKPRTYVNRSGQAVKYLLDRFHAGTDLLLVIYDDMDMLQGRLRIRPKGSAGGHNGLKSIIETLGSTEFPRIRVGIGRPPHGGDQIDYVLSGFSRQEREIVNEQIALVGQAVAAILTDGLDIAMSQFN